MLKSVGICFKARFALQEIAITLSLSCMAKFDSQLMRNNYMYLSMKILLGWLVPDSKNLESVSDFIV